MGKFEKRTRRRRRKRRREEEEEKKNSTGDKRTNGINGSNSVLSIHTYIRCRCSFSNSSHCMDRIKKKELDEKKREREKEKERKRTTNKSTHSYCKNSTLDNYDLWPTCMHSKNIILSKDSCRLIDNNNNNSHNTNYWYRHVERSFSTSLLICCYSSVDHVWNEMFHK